MKKIVFFVSLFVIIVIVGTTYFINRQNILQTSKNDSVKSPEKKEQEVIKKNKLDENLVEEIITTDELKLSEESNIPKDITKTESKIEQDVEESKPKQEVIEETKIPVIEDKPMQQTPWEKLGITEYDYHNKPMWSWARIDFNVNDFANAEETINACRSYGNKIMQEQGLGFSCSSINSYSGNYLGEMLKSNLKSTIIEKINVLKKYLNGKPEIKEVIFSGGDPLSIGYDNLLYALEELKDWNIRIHTRAIVYEPSIFDDNIINLLKIYKVRLVFHINHPYEICNEVENKIEKINKFNIRMYAQFPLLRGINDNAEVLKKLLLKMDELHIRPLSIFIPDPISYGASFRVSFKRIIEIMDEINWHSPSWINSTRFTMDTTIGKVRRENIIAWNDKCITFSREGKKVEYYDLDDNIDVPGDIKKLLWKDFI